MYKEKIVAIIFPAREGSKGIKNKNIKKLNGLPLISYSILSAKKSKPIKYLFQQMVKKYQEYQKLMVRKLLIDQKNYQTISLCQMLLWFMQ